MRHTAFHASVILVVVVLLATLTGCPMEATYSSTITPIYGATNAGLYVYNGTSWTDYTTSNGLLSNSVTSVVVSGSGSGATVLAGTANGISYTSSIGSTWSSWTTSNGLASNTIDSIFLGASSFYAATTGGLSAYNFDGSSPTWTSNSSITTAAINGVFVSDTYTYVAADKLYVYNGTEQTAASPYAAASIVSGSSKVTALIGDSSLDIIAATDNGLNILYSGSSSWLTTPLLSGVVVNGIFLDKSDNLYAATAKGLYNLSNSSSQPILSGAISCVYVDGAGTIYAGTATGLETYTASGKKWTASSWSAQVNAIVTTAPLYSF